MVWQPRLCAGPVRWRERHCLCTTNDPRSGTKPAPLLVTMGCKLSAGYMNTKLLVSRDAKLTPSLNDAMRCAARGCQHMHHVCDTAIACMFARSRSLTG